MRGGGFGRLSGSPGFDNNDRLLQCDFPRGREETASIDDRFHVDDDAARMRIAAEVFDQVAPIHVCHGTGGDDCAESDPLAITPLEDSRAQCAALTQKSDVANVCNRFSESAVESRNRTHYAKAVRPDET